MLHQIRIQSVVRRLRQNGARSVLDLGCGDGSLVFELLAESKICSILALDQSGVRLAAARERLAREYPRQSSRVSFVQGCFTRLDQRFCGFDAAVMLETIEHLKPCHLSKLEGKLFTYCRPSLVVITTPNSDYNAVFNHSSRGFRHKDHKFEWGRAKFKSWACGVAARNGYGASFEYIGCTHPTAGAPTQMAVFELINSQGVSC